MEILYGYRSVLEALKNKNRKINKLYISKSKLQEEINNKTIIGGYKNIQIITNEELDYKCKSPHHNSVALEVNSIYNSLPIKELKDYILILDNVTDVGNLGAIIRSAGILGFDLILSRNDNAPINGIVGKNAAGGLEYVNIYICGSLLQVVQQLKKQYYFIVGATEKQKDLPVIGEGSKSKPDKIVIVMGGEYKGISASIMKELDFVLNLPGRDDFNVYNVSVAAALSMFLLKK
jgi:23S rRNA (guanosine2251-2'-O)-methyltransferase